MPPRRAERCAFSSGVSRSETPPSVENLSVCRRVADMKPAGGLAGGGCGVLKGLLI
jgi:hypothetical protein